MIDLFTKKELEQLASEAKVSAFNVLNYAEHHVHGAAQLSSEIGNNVTHAIASAMSEMLPHVEEDLSRLARCSIWASEQDGVGRAGLNDSAADRLKRLVVSGAKDNADMALSVLERYLFALFVAVRRLRKLPAECHYQHTVTVDQLGPICIRCGERPEQ